MITGKLKLTGILLLTLVGLSCSDDDTEELMPEPSMDELEIGSGNNQGVIGRDFHFNARVIAGSTIDIVQININPMEGETYSNAWSFEIVWDDFKGLKNSTVHKHFDIPEDAPEGRFEFKITISDENGTKLEETYEVNLIDPENLPVDPYLYLWFTESSSENVYFVNELLENPEEIVFAKNDTITSQVSIRNVKDDGQLYILFIKKSADHLPESLDDIDFSKAIVYDVFAHENETEVFTFTNSIRDPDTYEIIRGLPEFIFGAQSDNYNPTSNSIEGEKAWENGEYYFGIIYENFTHNVSVYHYMEATVKGF